MDIFTVISWQTILAISFILGCFLIWNRQRGKSRYFRKGIYYSIKFCLAKRIVKAAQKKSRTKRKNLIDKNIEPNVTFSSEQSSHYQSFSGCDQKGNSIKLKFILKPSHIAEVTLNLKLSNGSNYVFPGSNKTSFTRIKDYKWKINGLTIETLEPYRRLRIVFNGLLRNIFSKSEEQVEHVQFNFIFNCCSSPMFYPEDCDGNLIAESLASRRWRDLSYNTFLFDYPSGYEQFGALLGLIKGDSFSEEKTLNLATWRTVNEGPSEKFLLQKEAEIFLAETNGVLIHLTFQSFGDGMEKLTHGYVCHKNYITEPITYHDIQLDNLEINQNFPDRIKGTFRASSDEYVCEFYLNKFVSFEHPSLELYSGFAECDVNNSKGKALVEFSSYKNLRNLANIKQLNSKSILSENKVDVLPESYVVNIKSPEAKIIDIAGGKGTSLALLKSFQSDEFLIPDGFVVTINAFKRQLEENKILQEVIENINDAFCGKSDEKPEAVCASAIRLFTNESVHPEIAKDIVKNLRKVSQETASDAIDVVSWAVRSSAIGEDSEEFSAAGQNETILGCVTDNEVLKAVSKCWASLFTYQSAQYRWQHGISIKNQMAVVIQKMVPSETAGVLFTWHPTTSNPSEMVITSNFGLGESVVSGTSDPDTFILHRTYDGKVYLRDKVIGAKEKVLVLTENGIKEVNTIPTDRQEDSFVFVNGDNRENWSLSKEQILKLGRIGVILEEAFGGPRDIEWAYYKEEVYLLQSRPITTLTTWSDFELTHEFDSASLTENSLFTIANIGEVLPMAVNALNYSTIIYSLDKGMQLNVAKQINPYFLQTINTFYNRAFLDCILFLYFTARDKEIDMSTKVLDLAVFGHPVINEEIRLAVRERLGPLPSFFNLNSFLKSWKTTKMTNESVRKSKAFVKNVNFDINDDDNSVQIYEKIVKNQNVLNTPAYYHSLVSSSSVFWQIICMMVLLGKKKELTTEHYMDFANILSSCEDVESAEVPLYLEKIARIVKDEGYSDEFCTIKPEFGPNWLKIKCPAAYKLFEQFVTKHGHRCLGEFDLSQETWDMNLSQIILMIQANTKHLKEISKKQKTVNEVIDELVSPVNVITKCILKYVLSNLRNAVGKREQTKSALILANHKTRLAYRKLAKEMVREGLMPSESLVFHLTKFELGEILRERNPLLINKAIKRQKLYATWNNFKFPELNYGLPQPEKEFFTPIELLPGSKCTGTPVCAGNVQARACVIVKLDQISLLERGDILITYSTDIGWSPYFPMLSGVVTELGGLVSHGAVVAREYGLPCIVGVKNATKIFKTGDIVYLSGKTGDIGKV